MGLDSKIKSLIAVGASITANCQPCIKHHVGKALENGAEEKEILEAIEVGKSVRMGAASHMDKFTESVVKREPFEVSKTGDRCCC
jgi:AhpD family alkylhydroperoxidase